jgi:hypothetical protein
MKKHCAHLKEREGVMPDKRENVAKASKAKATQPPKNKPRAKPKPKPKPRVIPVKESGAPSREMYAKLQKIGRNNVERHAGYESKQVLRQSIARHQVNHQHQMEHDRLLQASVQGPLQAHAESRLQQLKNLVR